jgi:hypothetical protein
MCACLWPPIAAWQRGCASISADCPARTAQHGLPSTDCPAWTAQHALPSTDCLAQTAQQLVRRCVDDVRAGAKSKGAGLSGGWQAACRQVPLSKARGLAPPVKMPCQCLCRLRSWLQRHNENEAFGCCMGKAAALGRLAGHILLWQPGQIHARRRQVSS